jgi:hypothetical protein
MVGWRCIRPCANNGRHFEIYHVLTMAAILKFIMYHEWPPFWNLLCANNGSHFEIFLVRSMAAILKLIICYQWPPFWNLSCAINGLCNLLCAGAVSANVLQMTAILNYYVQEMVDILNLSIFLSSFVRFDFLNIAFYLTKFQRQRSTILMYCKCKQK